MQSLVLLTREPIPQAISQLPAPWLNADSGVTRGHADLGGPIGAWLDFYGIVRGFEAPDEKNGEASPASRDQIDASSRKPREIRGIDYEAHEAMAQHQLENLVAGLAARYPIKAMLVIHRVGVVTVGEPSLLVRILTPHRGEALRACADFIDELKQVVPIWKHPQWT